MSNLCVSVKRVKKKLHFIVCTTCVWLSNLEPAKHMLVVVAYCVSDSATHLTVANFLFKVLFLVVVMMMCLMIKGHFMIILQRKGRGITLRVMGRVMVMVRGRVEVGLMVRVNATVTLKEVMCCPPGSGEEDNVNTSGVGNRFAELNDIDLLSPELDNGMRFGSVTMFKAAVREYNALRGKTLHLVRMIVKGHSGLQRP